MTESIIPPGKATPERVKSAIVGMSDAQAAAASARLGAAGTPGNLVTLDTAQTVTGPKNFTGALTKNGVPVATVNDIPAVPPPATTTVAGITRYATGPEIAWGYPVNAALRPGDIASLFTPRTASQSDADSGETDALFLTPATSRVSVGGGDSLIVGMPRSEVSASYAESTVALVAGEIPSLASQSIVIGRDVETNGYYHVCVGSNARVDLAAMSGAVVAGQWAVAGSSLSVVAGCYASSGAYAYASVVIGARASTSNYGYCENSAIVGADAGTDSALSCVFGYSASVNYAHRGTAIGAKSYVSNDNSEGGGNSAFGAGVRVVTSGGIQAAEMGTTDQGGAWQAGIRVSADGTAEPHGYSFYASLPFSNKGYLSLMASETPVGSEAHGSIRFGHWTAQADGEGAKLVFNYAGLLKTITLPWDV